MARKVGMGRSAAQSESNRWEDYLDPGERLLWQGAPASGLRFTPDGLAMSAFGAFFLGISVFIAFAGIMAGGGMGAVFSLFTTPFILVGLWLVVGHWFFDAYKRKHSRYALTTKRAIIARSVMGRKMLSYEIGRHSPISLVEGNLDTVNFDRRTYLTKNGTKTVLIGFRFIKDGREVFRMLQDIKDGKYK
jgi:hypothetical protein